MGGVNFGKGITWGSKDPGSLFSMQLHTRLQSRFVGTESSDDDVPFNRDYLFRRGRIKLTGFAFTPRLRYEYQYDYLSSETFDAIVKWNFAGNFDLWIGQAILPNHRDRHISSQKLQFVERSLLSANFNFDRDKGIQLRHHFTHNDMIFRQWFALSKGDGREFKGPSSGRDFTARLEFLPLGKFTNDGEYSAPDLARETSPKVAIGLTYGFNNDALKARGQLGPVLSETRDLQSHFFDIIYKYRGWSVMAEYAHKQTTDGSAAIFDENNQLIESFYTGSGFNAQVGRVFNNNWELSSRVTIINPHTITGNNDLREYTVGLSKYFVGHSLKIQADLSVRKQDNKANSNVFRLQLELAF